MNETDRLLLSGDEAIALAARDAGVALGAGYPGTPSTEILESFSERGGRAQWSTNEKVALEVALTPPPDWRAVLKRPAPLADPRAYQPCLEPE